MFHVGLATLGRRFQLQEHLKTEEIKYKSHELFHNFKLHRFKTFKIMFFICLAAAEPTVGK
jgi:hypothetical protein